MAKRVVPFPFPKQPHEITSTFLGAYVKAKRTHSGLTMHQAAMLCGVSVDVFTKLENAKGGVTLESFLKVANGLGLDMKFGEHA
jgi:transcriptional regulator with XRE-family HTH domain